MSMSQPTGPVAPGMPTAPTVFHQPPAQPVHPVAPPVLPAPDEPLVARAPEPVPDPRALEPIPLTTTVEGFGTIHWWSSEQMPPRKKRELDVAGVEFATPMARALSGMDLPENVRDLSDDDKIKLGAALFEGGNTDTRLLFQMNEITAYAYLRDWQLAADGHPLTLPSTADEVLDLPRPVYDHVLEHSAKLDGRAKLLEQYAAATGKGNGFGPDSALNPHSPTVPSGA